MAIDVAQCSVRLVYERTSTASTAQTFILAAGGRLRIGRHADCDYVLDVEGVSACHVELFLQHANAGQDPLVVRDKSKNGTGMRPGPCLTDRWFMGIAPAWERLKPGGSRSLDHGWQLLMPLKADKRTYPLTIYLDNKLDASELKALDGERCSSAELKQAEELFESLRQPTLVQINSEPPKEPTPEPSTPPESLPPSPIPEMDAPIPGMDEPPIPDMDAPPLPPEMDAPPLPPGEPGPPLPSMAPPPPPDAAPPPLPPGAPPPPPSDFAPPLPPECPPPPPTHAPPTQFGEPPPPPPSMNGLQNVFFQTFPPLPQSAGFLNQDLTGYQNPALPLQARFGNLPPGTFFPPAPQLAQGVVQPPNAFKGATMPAAPAPAREMDWNQLEREVDRESKFRRRF